MCVLFYCVHFDLINAVYLSLLKCVSFVFCLLKRFCPVNFRAVFGVQQPSSYILSPTDFAKGAVRRRSSAVPCRVWWSDPCPCYGTNNCRTARNVAGDNLCRAFTAQIVAIGTNCRIAWSAAGLRQFVLSFTAHIVASRQPSPQSRK